MRAASTQPDARARAGAITALIAANLFWAGNYVVGATAVREMDPIALTFLRWVIAAPILLALAAIVERPDWRAVARALPRLALLGALGMIGFVAPLYESLRHTTPVSASLISSVSPVLIAITAAALLRERIGARMLAGLAVGLVGVVLVVSKGSVDAVLALDLNVGDAWVLLAVAAWTIYTVLGRRPLPGVPPVTSTAVQATLAALMLAPVVAVTGFTLPQTGGGVAALAYIVLGPSVGSYLLWNIALRRVTAGTAAITLNLLPVFTVAIALALGTTATPAELIGGAIVLAGVLLATWRTGSRG